MRCPQCTCQDDKVVDSRASKEGAGVRRRRECLNCGHRFTTYEQIIQAELKVVKRKDNIREDFDREKLQRGIEKACWKRPIDSEQIDELVNQVVAEIESKFDKEIDTTKIGEVVMTYLKSLDQVAYVRFASVYRDFKDIDEFISEIRSLGNNRK